jgi:aspartyl aminopeptidase
MIRRKMSYVASYLLSLLVALLWSCHMAKALASIGSMPPLTARIADHLPLARKAMDYIDSSPDPFFAVQTSIDLLTSAGFEELPDGVPYRGKVVPGGKYYFTRNKSTLVAFSVGKKVDAAKGVGFHIIGGHTDSPNLKVKPRSKRGKAGTKQIGVECYGGGLWHTWFDRDLGVSGRVMIRKEDGKIEQKLVKLDRAILRVPNLAIHLQTSAEREAFTINKEDHLSPILALEAKKSLTGSKSSESDENENDDKGTKKEGEKDGWSEYQEPLLLQLVSEELGVDPSAIVDFELNLFDVQKAALGGAYSEFIHSARLDNLASCFLAVQAIVEHVRDGNVDEDEDVSMVVLYDHEEVGSASA